jgi:hypothetical protein
MGWGLLAGLAMILLGPSPGMAKKPKKGIDPNLKKEMLINPDEMPEDFGQLKKDTQAEWAQRRQEIQAEIQAERQEIIRLLGDERKAIKVMWGDPQQTSIDQFKLDPAFEGRVTYKDGYMKATSVVVVDNPKDPAEIEDAKKKGQQHARAVLDQEIKDLKPTNGISVGDELKKPNPKLDEKKLDQFVTTAGQSKVEKIVDLPEGKKGVQVSVQVPMADPTKPNLTQVLKPMVAEPAAEVKAVQSVLPPAPPPPPPAPAPIKPAPAVTPPPPPAQPKPVTPPPAPLPPAPVKPVTPPAAPLPRQGGVKLVKPAAPPPAAEPEFNAQAWIAKQGPIGGLVVDTRGTGFQPCLFPRLMDSYDVIYFAGDMSNTTVGKMGVAGWARSVDAATTEPRLTPGGSYTGEPLLLDAQEVQETVENKIILKESGSAKIKAGDGKYHFLDKARVVVVVE